MSSGINQHLSVEVCSDANEAIAKGYHYRSWEVPPAPLLIEKVLIIREGTVAGNSTVDLVLVDEHGKKYVTMVTGNLLKVLPL